MIRKEHFACLCWTASDFIELAAEKGLVLTAEEAEVQMRRVEGAVLQAMTDAGYEVLDQRVRYLRNEHEAAVHGDPS